MKISDADAMRVYCAAIACDDGSLQHTEWRLGFGRRALAEAAKILLQPMSEQEYTDLSPAKDGIALYVRRVCDQLLAKRLNAVTEAEVDPAMEAVRIERGEITSYDDGSWVFSAKAVKKLATAVRKSDGERHDG